MNREILRLAIPNILSTLSIPLLGIVDTALMGRESGAAPLAGMALGGVIFNLIFMVVGVLRMSITGFTAICHFDCAVNFEHGIFRGNFGVRYIETEVSSVGFGPEDGGAVGRQLLPA